jgi:hypothetical protein
MIGHQTIGPNLCAGGLRRHRDQTAVKLIILGSEEHRLAAITTLADMMRQAAQPRARSGPCARLPFAIFKELQIRTPYLVNCHRNPGFAHSR